MGQTLHSIMKANEKSFVRGFTTNPSLMRKAGVASYEDFAKSVLSKINNKPVSFEVFADDDEEIIKQAKKIFSWGPNVFVKVPITNTKGKSMSTVLKELSNEGIPLNVTAMMTSKQVEEVMESTNQDSRLICSVFAGRIADTGIDPAICMKNVCQ